MPSLAIPHCDGVLEQPHHSSAYCDFDELQSLQRRRTAEMNGGDVVESRQVLEPNATPATPFDAKERHDAHMNDVEAWVSHRSDSSFDGTRESLGRASPAGNGDGDISEPIRLLASLTSQIGAVLEGLVNSKSITDDRVAANLTTMLSTFTRFSNLCGDQRAKRSPGYCQWETSTSRELNDVGFHNESSLVSIGADACSETLPMVSRHSTMSLMLRLVSRELKSFRRASTTERSLADIVRESSVFARVALFCGGHANFEMRNSQIIYNTIFVFSFLSCFLVCIVNMIVRTPPYNYMWLDALTAYLHVVGLHSWWHWRQYGHDPTLVRFVQDMTSSSDPWTKNALRALAWQTHVGCGMVLMVQLLLIGLAFLALCQPAFEHWMSASDDSGFRTYSLLHALVMWSVIPQHIPTIVSGHVLFFFVIRLHTVDFMRAVSLVGRINLDPKYKEFIVASTTVGDQMRDEGSDLIDKMTVIAEKAQDRLDRSCDRLSWLWIHQLVYAFCQILVVAIFCSPLVQPERRDQTLQDIQAVSRFGFCLPMFHGTLGVSVLLTTLIGPAMTTYQVTLAPKLFLKTMRQLGASVAQTETRIAFLDQRLIGFNYDLHAIDMTWVWKFISLVVLGISFATWSEIF